MGKLKIRMIRDELHEKECRWVCIDPFDEGFNSRNYHYKYGCGVFESKWVGGKLYRGKMKNNISLNIGFIPAYDYDVAEKADIIMYLKLGEILRKEGYVFNKKKGELVEKKKMERR